MGATVDHRRHVPRGAGTGPPAAHGGEVPLYLLADSLVPGQGVRAVGRLSPHRSIAFAAAGEPASVREAAVDPEVPTFEQMILANLRQAGIQSGRKQERLGRPAALTPAARSPRSRVMTAYASRGSPLAAFIPNWHSSATRTVAHKCQFGRQRTGPAA